MYTIHVQAHSFKGKSEFSYTINFTTKVNVEDIPQPYSVEYNKDTGRMDVTVLATNIDLIGQVEVKTDNTWLPYGDTFPVIDGKGSLQLTVPKDKIETVRVSLCLRSNPTKCGVAQEADGK